VRGQSIQILMVEDNEGDVLLTTQALKSAQVANTWSSRWASRR
jgi:hypothetical protein